MKDKAAIIRFAAYRIHQSLVEKPLTIERFWPLEGDKPRENTTLVFEEGLLDKIFNRHKIDK